jgi:hypothetical protein
VDRSSASSLAGIAPLANTGLRSHSIRRFPLDLGLDVERGLAAARPPMIARDHEVTDL